jgi:hypothetical protein
MEHEERQVRPSIELRHEGFGGVPLMDDHRQAFLRREFELVAKGSFLLRKRWTSAEEIEARLANGHGMHLAHGLAQLSGEFGRERLGVPGMMAQRDRHHRVSFAQTCGSFPTFRAVADVDDRDDADCRRGSQHIVAVGIKCRVVQVGVRIDDWR